MTGCFHEGHACLDLDGGERELVFIEVDLDQTYLGLDPGSTTNQCNMGPVT